MEVAVEVDVERRLAWLSVRDTGVGIPEAELPHIFERFYRCDRSRDRHGRTAGTGLGLSICHAITNASGGEIRVVSQVDRGTTFTVELPLAGENDD